MADLDDFDAALEQLAIDSSGEDDLISPSWTAKKALDYIDTHWYTAVNRRGRWMDLIGDYAGTEPFVVDGVCFARVTTIVA